MRASRTLSADHRDLITVRFERETPAGDGATIETVFELRCAESFLAGRSSVVIPLSCTRIDTREPVVLTETEREQVYQEATECACVPGEED